MSIFGVVMASPRSGANVPTMPIELDSTFHLRLPTSHFGAMGSISCLAGQMDLNYPLV